MGPRDDDPDDGDGEPIDDGWSDADDEKTRRADTPPPELPPPPPAAGGNTATTMGMPATRAPAAQPAASPSPMAPVDPWAHPVAGMAEVLARRKKQELVAVAIGGALFLALFVYSCSVSNDRDDVREEVVATNEAKKQVETSLANEQGEKTKALGQVTACKKDREADKQEASVRVSKVEADLSGCRESVGKMASQQEEAKKKLDEFNALTASFQKMIDTGALEVEIRRGEMVVKLPAGVLFASGSAELSKAGKTAIGQVADVLETMPDRRFTVAGHTDNYTTKGTKFSSNWELSAARAVTVTEMLIAEGMKADRLVAAGYGEHAPIASNKTERGRLLNRRIEIILEPDLAAAPTAPKGKGKGKGK